MKIAGITLDDINQAIQTDPNWIASSRFKCSMRQLLERYPDGVPPEIQTQALLMTEAEIEAVYAEAMLTLQAELT